MCTYACVCVCVCVYLSVCVCACVSQCVWLHVAMKNRHCTLLLKSASVFLFVPVSVSTPVAVSVALFTSVIDWSMYVSASAPMSAVASVFLSVFVAVSRFPLSALCLHQNRFITCIRFKNHCTLLPICASPPSPHPCPPTPFATFYCLFFLLNTQKN